MASCSTRVVASATSKRIIAIRHSTTECNEALARQPWGSPGFKDPLLWDTRLSSAGITKAENVHAKLKQRKIDINLEGVQLICSSPLTRALDTAEILFKNGVLPAHSPRIALPLLRERLYLASDVGKPRSHLQKQYAKTNWSFDLLPHDDTPWWYVTGPTNSPPALDWRPKGTYPCPGEPVDAFHARIAELKSWLLNRDEQCIVIIAHWGLLRGLFGINADNCGIHELTDSDFLPALPADC